MKKDFIDLYRLVCKNKLRPEAIKIHNISNYTNVAIVFVRSLNGGQLTHYLHIYR